MAKLTLEVGNKGTAIYLDGAWAAGTKSHIHYSKTEVELTKSDIRLLADYFNSMLEKKNEL